MWSDLRQEALYLRAGLPSATRTSSESDHLGCTRVSAAGLGGGGADGRGTAQVSMMVTTVNNDAVVVRLLLALLDTAAEAPGGIEVIVVDEASSSDLGAVRDTLAAMTWYFGIRTVFTRNDPPLGFGGANDAAIRQHSRGEYVLLLNNDAVPLPGWLFAFLTTFREHSRIPGRQPGLVGPMFLGDNVLVAELGGAVYEDANAGNVGRGTPLSELPSALLVARPVDYVSAACVMLRRDVYLSLGGFDPVYGRGYYEDTDLAMAVRKAGLQVLLQPAAAVFHQEGGTFGTDGKPAKQKIDAGTGKGSGGGGPSVKDALMTRNRGIFESKWRAQLRRWHVDKAVGGPAASTWARIRPALPAPAAKQANSGDKSGAAKALTYPGASTFAAPAPPLRVFFIDATVPQPDRDSGSVRLYWLLRILVEQGVAVDFMPDWNEEMKYVTRMRLHGVHVLPARDVSHESMRQLLLYSDAEWSILQSLAEREPKAQPAGGASLPPYGKRTRCRYDIIVVARMTLFSKYAPLVRELCPSARLVFDTVDLHFLREARLAISDAASAAIQQRTSDNSWSFHSLSTDAILAWLRDRSNQGAAVNSVRRTMLDELRYVGDADVTVVVSTEEVRVLGELAPVAPVVVVSNVQDTEDAPPAPSPCNADGEWAAALPAIRGGRPKGTAASSRRRGVLFVGSLNHTPNSQAIAALLSEIMPLVWAQEPTISLHVVGAQRGPDNLRDKLTQRAGASNGTFIFHGHLSDDDLSALYRSVAVAAAPLFSGAGVKGKVNQAMKLGTPVVATPLAVEGMRMVEGVTHLQAASAQAFADAILRLHADCSLWHSLSIDGRESFAKHFSVQAGTVDVIAMLATTMKTLPARTPPR